MRRDFESVCRYARRFGALGGWLGPMAISLALCGCSPDDPGVVPARRAVKVEAVGEVQSHSVRFTGTVRERQRADLAFESGGQMVGLAVDVGDPVRKGQVLATLDPQPARLHLQQARARLASSQAQVTERTSNLVRQQHLFAAGSVAQSVVEQAAENREQARAEQRRAQADLALAQREVERSRLVAPFDGRVVSRRTGRYSEVGAGQAVLEIESVGDQQVVASVPVDQAAGLKPGDVTSAYRTDARDGSLELVLEGVSPRAENGLTRLCIFRVRQAALQLPSGLAMLVHIKADGLPELSIPERALWVGTDKPYVYVYLPSEEKVVRRPVTIARIEGGRALIESGLSRGEWVVTAGASFINDGQLVSLFRSTTRLSEN